VLSVVLAAGGVWAGPAAGAEPPPQADIAPASASAVLPIAFIPNHGQWDTPAAFVVRQGPMVARLEKDAIVLQLATRGENGRTISAVVRMTFEGAAEDVVITGQQQQSGRYSFFLSNDRSKWRTDVPAFGQVLYRRLYDGVDLRVREEAGRLEYDLVLAPGADLSQVTVCCEGIDGLDIDVHGSLVMQTALGPITQKPPIAWFELPSGEREPVECRFATVDEQTYGFDAPRRDAKHALVIDPPLEWSTYLGGGEANDGVWRVAVDEQKIVTIGGWAFSPGFPSTPGVYDETFNLPYSMFVAKLDPAEVGAGQLVWCTFIGGTGGKVLWDLVTDVSGAATIVGETDAIDFPTTDGAYDETHNGLHDAFVCRISADLGAPGNDWASDLDVNSSGAVVVGGYTDSDGFPTTPGAYDTTFNGGGQDAWEARLDPSQAGDAQLVWSTFLGGTGNEGWPFDPLSFNTGHMGVDIDEAGVVTVSGGTSSTDFPTTVGAYDTTYNGGSGDGFISRFSADGTTLMWSTFLGGSSGREPGMALAVDADGVVTTAGYTWSSNFPTTPGAYDETHDISNDGFVARLDPSLPGPDQLVYSTFVGGNSWDPIYDIALHGSGVVTAAARTGSVNYPSTPYSYDPTDNPGGEGILFRLDPAGEGDADLVYSTFLGGAGNDAVVGLALQGPADVIVGGFTTSNDFPVTSGAYQEVYPGSQAGFVAKLHLTPCPWDLNRDGEVGVNDFLQLLADWGSFDVPADFDGGGVGITDFLLLIGNWGPCP
jgi:hypothetical protein